MSGLHKFCSDCPDGEACASGYPCEEVRKILNHVSDTRDPIVDEPTELMKKALEDWWINKAQDEVTQVAPKAVEYSAVDLIEFGRTLALVMGLDHMSDEEYGEIGIWGYLVGKVARWTGAIKEGRRVSDDTLHDIKVYTAMAQRNRDVGGWPFGPGEEN